MCGDHWRFQGLVRRVENCPGMIGILAETGFMCFAD